MMKIHVEFDSLEEMQHFAVQMTSSGTEAEAMKRMEALIDESNKLLARADTIEEKIEPPKPKRKRRVAKKKAAPPPEPTPEPEPEPEPIVVEAEPVPEPVQPEEDKEYDRDTVRGRFQALCNIKPNGIIKAKEILAHFRAKQFRLVPDSVLPEFSEYVERGIHEAMQ